MQAGIKNVEGWKSVHGYNAKCLTKSKTVVLITTIATLESA